jgi:hypothetical protein
MPRGRNGLKPLLGSIIMIDPISPSDRLHKETLEAIGDLTDYRVGHIWAESNNRNPLRLMALSRNWRLKQPKTLSYFAELMDAIGYRVTVVRK